jgi:hypothetical protein
MLPGMQNVYFWKGPGGGKFKFSVRVTGFGNFICYLRLDNKAVKSHSGSFGTDLCTPQQLPNGSVFNHTDVIMLLILT